MKDLIPEATVRRLSHYLRCIEMMEKCCYGANLQSKDLARMCSISDSVVRRDLSYFGTFGIKGVGYDLKRLKDSIKRILGLTEKKKVVVVGVGNIGRALIGYLSRVDGFEVVAAFDNDPQKIGKKIGKIKIEDAVNITPITANLNAEIAVVAVPSDEAQKVVNRLIKGRVKGILNFALVPLKVPDNVTVRYIELLTELEVLTYNIKKRRKS